MITIGLDIGNGFVKAVSDGEKKVRFPSLVAQKRSGDWNEARKSIGEEAAKDAGGFSTTVISPIVGGSQADRQGYIELLKEAFRVLKIDPDKEDIGVCVGLPAGRVKEKPQLLAALKVASPNIQKYWIVPQAFGTAVYMGISDAIVINIGHGTTEYQVVENNIPSVGYSDSMAASILINDRTNAEYTNKNNFDTPEVKREIVRLVAYIKNQYEKLRAKSPKKYPLVIAGGGILIPGMKEEITKQFKKEFQVPDNPVFSNAIGMHRHAQRKSKVKPKEPAPSTENTVEPTTDVTPSTEGNPSP